MGDSKTPKIPVKIQEKSNAVKVGLIVTAKVKVPQADLAWGRPPPLHAYSPRWSWPNNYCAWVTMLPFHQPTKWEWLSETAHTAGRDVDSTVTQEQAGILCAGVRKRLNPAFIFQTACAVKQKETGSLFWVKTMMITTQLLWS